MNFRSALQEPTLSTDMETRPAETAPEEESATSTKELALASLAFLEPDASTRPLSFKSANSLAATVLVVLFVK